jgi:zinc protease
VTAPSQPAAQASGAAAPGTTPPAVTRKVFPNGLTLLVQENHAAPVVGIRGMLKAGSMYDPPGKSGLANFVAEMLPEGTEKRSWSQLADELEFVAADVNVASGISACVISGQSLPEHLETAVEILADELQHPSFPAAQIPKVRERIANAIREELDSTDEAAERTLYATIYPADHPLHHLPIGEFEEVTTVTRDDLLNFYREHYRPDMLILAIVGDVTPEAAVALVEKHFGGWAAQGSKPDYALPGVGLPQKPVRRTITMPGRSQVDIAIGFPGVRRNDPAYPACLLLNRILSGGNTGRLYREIREKRGLVYGVYSDFRASQAVGPFVLRMGANPKHAEEAISVALEQLRLIRKEGPTHEEMEVWKSYTSGRVALELETNAGIARNLVDAEFYGLGLDYPYRLPKIIAELTGEQVLAAAKQYLQPDHAVVVTAGPLRGGGEYKPAQ